MGSLIAYSGITTKVKAMERWRLTDSQFAEMAALESVPEAVEYLRLAVEREGGLSAAAEVMQGYVSRAVGMLSDYDDSDYRSALVNLCAYIVERDR